MTDKLVLTFVCGRNQNISNELVKVATKIESAKFLLVNFGKRGSVHLV